MKDIRVLFDTNVVVDFIEKRAHFAVATEQVFKLCKDRIIKGFIATQSVADIFYILRKNYTAAQRRATLLDVCDILDVIAVGKRQVLSALSDDTFPDLEDSILAKCAEDCGVDYIISRDQHGFATSKIPVVTPSWLLDKIGEFHQL